MRKHLISAEDGQGLVEIALVFTLLLMMVLGLIDFAYLYRTFIGVTNAANEGATFAANAAAYDAAKIRQAALAEGDTSRCNTITVTSTAPASDGLGMQKVTVTVRCQVGDLFLVPQSLHHLTISRTVSRRVRP